jgi:signal transduction histidine kinase
MRTAEDLQRITPLIWKELTTLGVPFVRCGVFIINPVEATVQALLSSPDGQSLGVLHLGTEENDITRNLVDQWQHHKVYREHWTRAEFIDWMQSMMQQGQLKDFKEYQGAESPPESLHLHFVPFKQGMLYIGNTTPLPAEAIELVQTLAGTFAIAYSRYEDFRQLEDAKNRVETTLKELKATQAQLVQSEKMASLGELTAGIAHEIQNPLNFVNNFSEVNRELISELKDEADQGNLDEVKAIASDILHNEEKIIHHGKRADAIVKSMLQHSRTGSGQKELTDLSALADEYLKLAYHACLSDRQGMRSQDQSFMVTLETEYDRNAGTVETIRQDIGRVLLNLYNNAFYAVMERKKNSWAGYEPKVSVSVKRLINSSSANRQSPCLEIRVKDNGMGIPEEIRDKIFQPFFTTKPTGQGTGLGLSLSYDIIKAHGGELKVETSTGYGSEFIIELPIT